LAAPSRRREARWDRRLAFSYQSAATAQRVSVGSNLSCARLISRRPPNGRTERNADGIRTLGSPASAGETDSRRRSGAPRDARAHRMEAGNTAMKGPRTPREQRVRMPADFASETLQRICQKKRDTKNGPLETEGRIGVRQAQSETRRPSNIRQMVPFGADFDG
jgi:hypothetical protein